MVRQHVKLFGILLPLYVLAWMLQGQLFLNWDVSSLLFATKKWLAGGTYSKEFFTPNPPLILYLYTPVVFLSQLMSTHNVILFRVYIFFLASLSLYSCYRFTLNIFAKEDSQLAYLFLIALIFIILFLPFYEFGQRDHLFFIFMMPYVLMLICRLQNKVIRPRYAISIGIFAGLGFALKPQFMIPFILMEFYFVFYKKNWLAFIRPETLAIVTIFFIYLFILFYFQKDYVYRMIPFLINNYYSSVSYSWKDLVNCPITTFSCITIMFYLIQFRDKSCFVIKNVLAIALIGSLASFFLQSTTWYYHTIPSFSLAFLLSVVLFTLFVRRTGITQYDLLLSIILVVCLSIILYNQAPFVRFTLIFAPTTFFCFFAILFGFLFYLIPVKKPPLHILGYFLLILTITGLYSYLAFWTSFYVFQFYSTLTLLFLLLAFCVSRLKVDVSYYVIAGMLGTLLFVIPFFLLINLYQSGLSYKKFILNKLIAFVRTQPDKPSVYFFSRTVFHGFPLVDYTNVNMEERFDCLWMIKAIDKSAFGKETKKLTYFKNSDSSFFLNMISEDLHEKKPLLVFIEKPIPNYHVDLLPYFLQNQRFRNEWKFYRYLTSIKFYKQDGLDVYKRTL